jgi:DNA-binding CsgD family transcriptional regulator
MAKGDAVVELIAQGIAPTQIAKRLGIARSSVYRVIEAKMQP